MHPIEIGMLYINKCYNTDRNYSQSESRKNTDFGYLSKTYLQSDKVLRNEP